VLLEFACSGEHHRHRLGTLPLPELCSGDSAYRSLRHHWTEGPLYQSISEHP
jgi:hypothetical protein